MAHKSPNNVDQLLQKMVQINSVNAAASGNANAERDLAQYLQQTAVAWGFNCRQIDVPDRTHNLLVLHEADPQKPWLMFESHMDTVSVEGMTIDPFAAEIRNGRLYGRGACDTKASGAAALWALTDYARLTAQPNNIAIHFTVDEEHTMTGVRQLVQYWDQLGFCPVGVIVGEPTMLQPVLAHNGVLRWLVAARGVAAHSSTPHLGKSAIRMINTVLTAIDDQFIPSLTAQHPLTGPAVCSVNVIRGGTQANVIPDHCYIEIDRRVTPDEDLDQANADFASFIDRLGRDHPDHGLELAVETIKGAPALVPDNAEGLYEAIVPVLESHNLPSRPVGGPYATDAGFLAAAGIPCVVLGPGDGTKAHTKDEYIDLDQLHLATAVYSDIMTANLT